MSARAPLGLWIATAVAVLLVIGTVARAPATRAHRRRALAWLMAWLLVDGALGSLGLFAADPGRTLPGIVPGILLPLLAGLWLLRASDTVGVLASSVPLDRLIGCQRYRVAGAVFLLGWAQGVLPAAFALPAGIGDICVGLAAPRVASRVARERPGWQRSAMLWNAAGLADLVLAVTLGALTSPSTFHPDGLGRPGYLTSRLPLVLIPVFAVPLSAVLHVEAIRRLRPGRASHSRGRADAGRSANERQRPGGAQPAG
jgi:hypothetical protein